MGPVKHKKLLNSRSRLLPVQMGSLHSISTWQLIPPDFSHSCSVFPGACNYYVLDLLGNPLFF